MLYPEHLMNDSDPVSIKSQSVKRADCTFPFGRC